MPPIAVLGSAIPMSFLAACGQGLSSTSERPLPGVTDPSTFVFVTASGSNVELRSVSTGQLVKDLGSFGESPNNNGLTLSPDGQYVYGEVLRNQTLIIERITASNDEETFIADGEQPSISPNGRLLAYAAGLRNSNMLVVRDLTSGNVRSINLSRFLGRQADLLNGSITWLGDGSEIVIAPGGVGSQLEPHATTTPPLPGSCDVVSFPDTCLIVVRLPTLHSFTAKLVILSGVSNPYLVSGTALPHSLLLAASDANHIVVDRADLSDNEANVVRLFSLPAVLPLAFDPRGTQLLYLVGHNPIALWIGQVTQHRLDHAHKLVDNARLANLAW